MNKYKIGLVIKLVCLSLTYALREMLEKLFDEFLYSFFLIEQT